MNAYQKMMKMNKEEIEAALKKLKQSKSEYPEGYFFAMCYAAAPLEVVQTQRFTCSKCNNEDSFLYSTYDDNDPDIINCYGEIASDFRELGYQVDICGFCKSCVEQSKGKLSTLMFKFKTDGMDNFKYTRLNEKYYDVNELSLVLNFLRGKQHYDLLNNWKGDLISNKKVVKILEKYLGIKIPQEDN